MTNRRITTGVLLLATALTAGPSQAESDSGWVSRLREGLDPKYGDWFVSSQARFNYRQGRPGTSSADIAKVFREDPVLARHVCAAVQLMAHFDVMPGSSRDSLSLTCGAYTPSAKEIQETAAALPSSLSVVRHHVLLYTTRNVDEPYPESLGYFPPPADTGAWLEGRVTDRDYAADVRAALNADLSMAARVCTTGEVQSTPQDSRLAAMHATLLAICATIPDSQIADAASAEKTRQTDVRLSAIFNSDVAEAEAQTPDERRRAFEELLTGIPRNIQSWQTYQSFLKLVALQPADERGMTEAVVHADWAAMSSLGGESAAAMKGFLGRELERRAASSSDWKRGQINFLLLTEDFPKALKVAKALAASEHVPSLHDQITAAVVSLMNKDPKPYESLRKKCASSSGPRSPDAEAFSEDCTQRLASLAYLISSQMGARTPESLQSVLVENNRNNAKGVGMNTIIFSPQEDSLSLETKTWFSATFNNALDEAAKMSRKERDQAGLDAMEDNPTLESALRVIALRPYDDRGPYLALVAIDPMFHEIDNDRRPVLRKLLTDAYERLSTSGPDAALWLRGYRGLLLFRGDYQRALSVSQQLMKQSDPQLTPRDHAILAVVELLNGHRNRYEAMINSCPKAPPDYAPPWTSEMTYCQDMAFSVALRGMRLGREQSPEAYREIMRKVISAYPHDWDNRMIAVHWLWWAGNQEGEREWQKVLDDRSAPRQATQWALGDMADSAEKRSDWKTALHLRNEWLVQYGFTDPGFPMDGWAKLIGSPDASCEDCENMLGQRLYRRAHDAVLSGEFEVARAAIEQMVPLALETGARRAVYVTLEDLAEQLIVRGQNADATRIVSYLAAQPLIQGDAERLKHIRLSLPSTASAEDVKPQSSPWDTVPHPPSKRPVRDLPAIKSG